MPQASTPYPGGNRAASKSIPKICRINGDDNYMLIYKNLGNNHAVPFVWSDSATLLSGTSSIVVASGIKFHGKTLAGYGNVTASPMSDPEHRWWVEKDTTDNRILIHTDTVNLLDVDFDLKFMIGDTPDMTKLYCRGNTGAMPNYP